MQPIVFLTNVENNAICQRLTDAISKWATAWSAQKLLFHVKRKPDTVLPNHFTFLNDNLIANGLGHAGLSDTQFVENIVFASLLEDVPQDDIKQNVIFAARLELLQQLDHICHHLTKVREFHDEPELASKYFLFEVQESNQSIRFELAISQYLALQLCGRKYTNNLKGLTKRASSIGKEMIGLAVDIPLGKVPLKSITDLAVGDVLLTNKPLSSEALVKSNNKVMLKAHLGKQGDNKAIIVEEVGE